MTTPNLTYLRTLHKNNNDSGEWKYISASLDGIVKERTCYEDGWKEECSSNEFPTEQKAWKEAKERVSELVKAGWTVLPYGSHGSDMLMSAP